MVIRTLACCGTYHDVTLCRMFPERKPTGQTGSLTVSRLTFPQVYRAPKEG
jgi:hypothetical protein